MTDFEDFHNRISKRLIAATFAVAMLLDFMPFSSDGFFWLPEFTALMLLYWAINRPQSVGVGTAFVVGMLTDIGTAAPLVGCNKRPSERFLSDGLSFLYAKFTV